MNSHIILSLVTGLLSGLALFLFGMNVMSTALTQLSGGHLEAVMDRLTRTRLSGWLLGVGVTAVVQSSSATTVMIVGLVNSGILKLSQTMSLVIGANLGTTATAWLVSLNSLSGESPLLIALKPSTFTPFLGILGIGFLMFWKTDRKIQTANVLIGFSVMMIGMNLMGGSVSPLKEMPAFRQLLTGFANPFAGYLFAMLFTMLIQSSDAAVGILQALAMASVGITYGMVIPVILGTQVGTCITSLLSSVGTGRNGKRAALLHLYYNLIKTVSFLCIFTVLKYTLAPAVLTAEATAVGIALFHTMINLVYSLLVLPFSDHIVEMVVKTIPYSEEELQEQEDALPILDPLLLADPAYAVRQAAAAVDREAQAAEDAYTSYSRLVSGMMSGAEEDAEVLASIRSECGRIAKFEKQIQEYLIKISHQTISAETSREIACLQSVSSDLSRIGGRIEKLLRIQEEMKNIDGSYSEEACRDLRLMGEAAGEILAIAVTSLSRRNTRLADTVFAYQEAISRLQAAVTSRHFRRLHRGICRPDLSKSFADSCFAYEQIVDDCDNIAGHLLMYAGNGTPPENPAYLNQVYSLFQDKYLAVTA